MKFIDMFAGIGGFRKGLEANGHLCVFSCEIDDNARKSYSAVNQLEEAFEKDITKLNPHDIPYFDIFCGGFPCQPFSRAGRRNGFNDAEKGNLFFSIIDIVKETRPKVVFLENVKGLLTSGEKELTVTNDGKEVHAEINKGATFRKILECFSSLGYDVQWQILDSSHFVPHKRERVYIIARRRDNTNFTRIFPLQADSAQFNIEQLDGDISQITSDFTGNIAKGTIKKFKIVQDEMYHVNQEVASDLENAPYQFSNVTPWGHSGIMIGNSCITYNLTYKPEMIHALKSVLQKPEEIDEKYILSDEEVEKQRYAKSAKTWTKSGNKMGNMAFPDSIDKPSRTLTANSSGREMMVVEFEYNGQKKYRKLTSLEYWRLQGFSYEDYYKAVNAGVPDSQLKKQAGNAVTVDVIKRIGSRLTLLE